jgi:hypothetical protein
VRGSEYVHVIVTASLLLLAAPRVLRGQSLPSPCAPGQSAPVFSDIGATGEQVDAFLITLKKAVASDDRRKVASLIRYPIAAWTGSKRTVFRTPGALVASYELIFTALLQKTIADARTECLFTNSQGAMIHDGEVWFNGFRTGALEIVTINK